MGNASTGFTLRVVSAGTLRSLGMKKVPQKVSARPMVGVPGTYLTSFQAAKRGKTSVKLIYSRPWEDTKGVKPAKSLTAAVVVR